ncbi:unnamed protein product [Moneuplotes crassus]|uniref:WDHD1/CFT4 second beta-propeller domain-containing protein n=1 Tax=Euplotes crassus TaxID=5936 RepID=A0AAD2D8I1_EUPCR|nr:unnamed protein product [Moneuplotes crassus]
MADLPTAVTQASVSGNGSFCFYKDQIVVVSEEGYIKKFDIDKTSGELKIDTTVPISQKVTEIVSNTKDNIVYSGKDKAVNMVFKEKFDKATKITNPSEPVHKLIYPNKKIVLICSEANHMDIYWIEKEKITKMIPEHDKPILNGDVDPGSEYIATTGCDGTLNICKLDFDPNKLELVYSSEISERVELYSEQKLQVKFSPDGKNLAIAGSKELRIAERNAFEDIKSVPEIAHDDPISQVCWVNSNILITADTQNVVKVWNFDTKKEVFKFTNPNDLVCMEYSQTNNCFALFDTEGCLVVSTQDFPSHKDLQPVEKEEKDDLPQSKGQDQKEDAEMEPEKPEESKFAGNYELDNDYPQEYNNTVNDFIGARPQVSIMPGNVTEDDQLEYRFLCWNQVGSVASRGEMNSKYIEVEFADKTFHKTIITEDEIETEMATLSHNGAFLASKAEEVDLDQYEDDTNGQKYISQLKFIPFTSWNSIKPWGLDLPKGENTEGVALGSTFCAVSTDSNYVRFFSLEGVQTFMMSCFHSVVCMAAYENLLCVVSHNGLPMLEAQNLKLKIIDTTKNYACIVETEVPVTPGATLQWMNFSEEGSLYTYDTDGIMRNLSFSHGNNWIPVLDVKQRYDIEPSKFWIIGISEGEISCCVLRARTYPTPIDKSHIQSFKLCIPLLGLDTTGKAEIKRENTADNEEKFIRESIELTHQQWRRHQWSSLRNSRTQKNPSYNQSKSIFTDIEMTQSKKALDKIIINSIRIAAHNDDKAKILSLARKLHLVKSYSLCITLLHEMKLPFVADELQKVMEKKEMEEQNERERQISSSQNSREKQVNKASSLSEKIMQARMNNMEKNSKTENAKKENPILARSMMKKEANESGVNKSVPNNPFANKENKKVHNKNFLNDLLGQKVEKKVSNLEKPKNAKQKL